MNTPLRSLFRTPISRQNFHCGHPLVLSASIALFTAALAGPARAADGTWSALNTGDASGTWSDPLAWVGGIIADGAGFTANFGAVDPTVPSFVHLDTPRTIGNLIFGDTDPLTPAGWVLDDNFDPQNILTLEVASGAPTITVNNLGVDATATISATLAGTSGLTKIGNGTLALTGSNLYTGTTSVNAGVLSISSNASLGDVITGSGIVLNGGTLASSASLTLENGGTARRPITLGANGGTLAPDLGTSLTVNGVISGAGTLTIAGAGTVFALGNSGSTYTGGTILRGRIETANNNSNAALTIFGAAVATNTVTFDGGYFRIANTTGGTSAGTLANNLIVNTSGTLEYSGRSATSGTLTGNGVFNVITHFIRSDNAGNWSGFAGTINVTSGDPGVSEFRQMNYNGFGGAILNLGTNSLTYIAAPNQANTTVALTGTQYPIGALSGVSSAVLRGGPIDGRVTSFRIGARNVDTEFAGAIETNAAVNRLSNVVKSGTGTLTLSGGISAYNGPTIINGGAIAATVLGNGGAVSSIGRSANAAANLIVSGGAFRYVGAGSSTDRLFTIGAIASLESSGTGPVNFTNSGPLALEGLDVTRTFNLGGTNIGANTLTPLLADNGIGVTSVSKNGAGTWALAGLNTYSGATTISGGVLSANTLADGGVPSSLGLSANTAASLVIDGGALRYSGAAASTDRGFTVGANGATLDASGTGAITFTNSAAPSLNGTDLARTIVLTGTNTDNNALAATLGNNGLGATSLVKNGAGTWALTGANTYSGTTTINGGLLRANNIAGSATGTGAVLINSGGSLGGIGTVSGAVTVSSGGHLAPGNGVGTLTLGSVTVNAGTIFDYEFNNTPANDLVVVQASGGLTLNPAGFNLFAEGTTNKWTTPGIYNLLQYNGALGGSGTTGLSVLNPQTGLTYNFGATGTFITLTIGSTVVISNWNVDANGSWGTAANWSAGVPNSVSAGANFLGAISAPRTVTLDGSRTIGTLQFDNANAYTIAQGSGGTLSLNNGASTADVVVISGSHTISAPVAFASNTNVDVNNAVNTLTIGGNIGGTGTLTKRGAGVLALNGTNTHASTSVQNGTLEIGSNAALGTGAFSFTGNATLRAGASALAPINSVSIGNNFTATIDTQGNGLTLSGVISDTAGNGALTKTGASTLVLAGSNTYGGVTTVAGGTLSVSDLTDGNLPSNIGQSSFAASNLVIDGGTLAYTGAGSASDRLFTIAPAGATLDASGTGALFLVNGGAIALTGTNVARTLTLTGTNVDGNTLSATLGNEGTGATSLVKSGAGVWVLAGSNTFSGPTTITGGTLKLGNGLALQGSTLSYNSLGGTLDFDALFAATLGGLEGSQDLVLENVFAGGVALSVGANNAATTYSGVLSGAGSLVKVGTGVLTLTGVNTFFGTTTIASGILRVAADQALSGNGQINVNSNFGLQLTNGVTLNNNIVGNSGANEFLDLPDAGAVATVGGAMSIIGSAQFRLGISGAGSTLNVTGNSNIGGAGTITFITRGNIVFSGTSSLTVNSANDSFVLGRSAGFGLNLTLKDSASISSGAIGIGGNQAGQAVTITLQDSATLTAGLGKNFDLHNINANITSTINLNGGALAAGGFIKTQTAAGRGSTINFNGGNLVAGTNNVNFLPALTELTAQVQAGGAKVDTNGFDITIAQLLTHDPVLGATPDGGLTKLGEGKLTIAAASSYTGPTTVSAGTLEFTTSQTLGALNIGDGATVVLTASAPGAEPEFGVAAPVDFGAQAVPEPGALALFSVGILSLLGRRRRAAL